MKHEDIVNKQYILLLHYKIILLILLTKVMVTKLINTCYGRINMSLNNKAGLILATTVLYLLLDIGLFVATAQH